MRGRIVLAATLAIIVWCVGCSLWWFVATRDDYSRLAIATECFGRAAPAPLALRCAGTKRSDIVFFKSAIDRKARNSRLAAAGGGALAALLLILLNQRLVNRRERGQA